MSKKIIKAHQKVVSDSMEEKKRFHLYKAGKLWLVAGMATFSFATAELTTQAVSADTVNPATPETSAKTATSSASGSVTLKAASSISAPNSVSVASSAATPSSATSSAASSQPSSATSSATSSEASSSASSKATSSATSKAASSEASSSASSKAAPSVSSKASSAVSSTASKATSSTAVKTKASTASTSTSSAASKDDAQADQKLNAQLKLGQVATVKQNGAQLILTIAKNQMLTQAQRDAIIDYAKKNHLSIEGLPKQTRANADTAATTDLSSTLFDKNTTKKGAAHDGDTITSDGTTLTISQLTDAAHNHVLSTAEVNRIVAYVKANNLKVVDTTNKMVNEIWYTDGSVTWGEARIDPTKKPIKALRVVSDPVLGIIATTVAEVRAAKWFLQIDLKSSDTEWSNSATPGMGVWYSKQFYYYGEDGSLQR
ncbi:hypothetical protein FEZ51_09215 [Pediococcus stilesii]|uniref:Uncharacterized protein n=1 Tax=Pediococcus stilesii TaxID=331679 RepID=A0A5R9BRX4_9LACO|nr:KxYKxGKxW signal peptide domain-containing protein [Pediococcus stilesii]TLQ03466.1 hypothetical protein FEZ51_09215 [Pediococcus stilesii]